MSCRFAVSTVAILGLICVSSARTAEPTIDPQLAPLARFAGEWSVDGKWSSGSPLRARTIYEPALAGKIIKARTFVMHGEREYQRYESTMAWHPERKCLYEISFAFDGAVTEYRLEAKDKETILIDFTPLDEAHPGKFRQTLHFVDDDHHTWKVEFKADSGWQTMIDATWARKKK